MGRHKEKEEFSSEWHNIAGALILCNRSDVLDMENIRFLPPFHYQTLEKEPSEVASELEHELQRLGLKKGFSLVGLDRDFYRISEIYQNDNETQPLTLARVYVNEMPDYHNLSQRIQQKLAGKCVTAQLFMKYSPDINLGLNFLLAHFFSKPYCERLRTLFFQFSERYPLLDDREYQEYFRKFQKADRWVDICMPYPRAKITL